MSEIFPGPSKDESRSPLKDRPLRNPGQSLDERLDSLLNDDLMVLVLVPLILWLLAGLEWFARWRGLPRMPGVYASMALIATCYVGFRFWRAKEQIRRLKLGRDGERVVGQFLEHLRSDGAKVFHDVIGTNFNIDHVVIAPQGVFVIETKTWMKGRSDSRIGVRDGQTYKDGRRLYPNPLDQAVAISAWLSQTLFESTGRRVEVWPVVLFPGWYVEKMDAVTKRTGWVLSGRELPDFLANEGIRLAEADVSLIAYHLSRIIRTGR
jgi:hypothetical protein